MVEEEEVALSSMEGESWPSFERSSRVFECNCASNSAAEWDFQLLEEIEITGNSASIMLGSQANEWKGVTKYAIVR